MKAPKQMHIQNGKMVASSSEQFRDAQRQRACKVGHTQEGAGEQEETTL